VCLSFSNFPKFSTINKQIAMTSFKPSHSVAMWLPLSPASLRDFALLNIFMLFSVFVYGQSSQQATLVKDIQVGVGNSNPNNFTTVGNTVYFTTLESTVTQLWKSDGTTTGTVKIGSILGNPQGYNGKLYYAKKYNLYPDTDKAVLWSFDGTTSTIVDTIATSYGLISNTFLSVIGSNLSVQVNFYPSYSQSETNNIRFLTKGVKGDFKNGGNTNSKDGGCWIRVFDNHYAADTLAFYDYSSYTCGNPDVSALYSVKKGQIWTAKRFPIVKLIKSLGIINSRLLFIAPESNASSPGYGHPIYNLYNIGVDGDNILIKANVSTAESIGAVQSFNGKVYYRDGSNIVWETDGTAAGTIALTDGTTPTLPLSMGDPFVIGDGLYFFDANTTDYRVWEIGTSGNIRKVLTVPNLNDKTFRLKVFNNELYHFSTANTSTTDKQISLFKIDVVNGTRLNVGVFYGLDYENTASFVGTEYRNSNNYAATTTKLFGSSNNASTAANPTGQELYQLPLDASCTNDNVAPYFGSCPSNSVKIITTERDTSWYGPLTAFDNCSTPNITQNITGYFALNVFPSLTQVITAKDSTARFEYTATDAKGNIGKCIFTVKVVKPCVPTTAVFNTACPKDTIISTFDACTRVSWQVPTATDNCGVAANVYQSQGLPSGSCFAVGVNRIVYKKQYGLDSCTFKITVNQVVNPCATDTIAPVFQNCPANISVTTAGTNAVVTWAPLTATDNCSGAAINLGNYSSGFPFTLGVSNVVFAATDAKGNRGYCNFTVTVSPQSIVKDVCASPAANILGKSGAITVTGIKTKAAIIQIFNSAWSSIYNQQVSVDSVTIPSLAVGTYNVKVTVLETGGRWPSVCEVTQSNVVVTAPVNTCGNGSLSFDGVNDFIITNQAAIPANTDFTFETLCKSKATETVCSGAFKRLFTLTLDNSNERLEIGDCSGQLTVYRNTPTALNGLYEISNANTLRNGAWHHIAAVKKSDSLYVYYDGIKVLTIGGVATINSVPRRFVMGSWVQNIENWNGEIDEVRVWNYAASPTQIQTLKQCQMVGNESGLVLYYPFNQGVAGGNNASELTVLDKSASANNATLNQFSLTGSTSNWICSSLTLTQGCPINPCENDVIAPILVNCPTNISLITTGATAVATWTAPTATDNCTTGPSVFGTQNSGFAFPVGTTVVTYTATDAKGNKATCSFNVNVTNSDPCLNETIPPVLSNCPANISLTTTGTTAIATWTAPTATDNCGTPSVLSNYNSGFAFPIGVTSVTYTATDGKGNKSTCSFNVTVTNQINTANCASNAQSPWSEWIKEVKIDTFINVSEKVRSDRYAVGYSDFKDKIIPLKQGQIYASAMTPGLSYPSYQSNLFFSAWIDFNGNNIFEDNEKILGASAYSNVVSGTFYIPLTAKLGNTVLRVSMKKDNWASPCETFAAGEVEDYTIKILANNNCDSDTTPPFYYNCPANISLTTTGTTSIATWIAPTATDNCGTPSVLSNYNSGFAFPLGTTAVTYTATDAKGNKATCSFNVVVAQSIGCRQRDSIILIDIYNNMGGGNWAFNNWDITTPIDTWYGVTLNANGCVVDLGLWLAIGNLRPSIGNLSELESLHLNGNGTLTGTLPSELGNLKKLKFFEGNSNKFTGSIPASFGNLTNLEDLRLYNNQLSGSIPTELGNLKKVKTLLLFRNQLSGEIPSSLGGLDSLKVLYASDNKLSGKIPNSLGNLKNVEGIELSSNILTDTIPKIIASLPKLVSLNLKNNLLSGCIPSEYKTLCGKEVDLSNNPNLLGGGNWAAFCNSNTGICPTITNDLELTMSANPSVFKKWTTINTVITLKNKGNSAYTNIEVNVPAPKGTSAGGTGLPTVGTWQPYCSGGVLCYKWSIPSLAANATATLTIPLFVLNVDTAIVATAKLMTSTPVDNNVANNTASVTISPAPTQQIAALSIRKPTQYIPVIIQKISPNPTDGDVYIDVESLDERDMRFEFFNAQGQNVYNEMQHLKKGSNLLYFNI
jgi:Leucine-rich repeat (LRR) protein